MLDPRDLQEMLAQQARPDPLDRPARPVPPARLALLVQRVPPELTALPVPRVRRVTPGT
jgi:hypothetical protein